VTWTVEQSRAYNREWMRTHRRLVRQKQTAMAAARFTLHDYACPYPVKGCRCRCLVVTDA
jgi:hypothetical protein